LPIHAPVQRVGEPPHLTLIVRVLIEVDSGGQRAGDQDGRVYGRQLRTPRAPAGRDIEEMIKEAPVPGRVRHRTLWSVPEEAQGGQRTLDRLCAGHERALDRNGIAGESQSHTGDAGRNEVA
jgi:hypothetical protein